MTIKRIYLTRRNPAISAQDFPREWRRHAAYAASFSTVSKRYTRVAQCTKFEEPPVHPVNDYAGVALLWMESLEVAMEINQDPSVLQYLRPDEVRVFGSEIVNCAMLTEERVVLEGTAAPVVVIEFLRRAPHLSAQDFLDAWSGDFSKKMLGSPTVKQYVQRYAQNRVIMPPPPGYEYDGVSEMWFKSPEDAFSLLESADYRDTLQAARTRFCNESGTTLMLTRVTHAWPAP
jgi:hypothetical protein